MEEENKNPKFLQSYLYTEHGDYFVSTAYRKSSAPYGGYYYETLAWTIKDKKRDKWIEENSGATSERHAIEQHLEVINKLLTNTNNK